MTPNGVDFSCLFCRQTPCHQEGSMWDIVADKLATALLMLGHSFPLQQALNGHRLASFVTEQHKLLRELLINQKSSDMVVVKVENAVSPESSSFSADAKLNDDDDGPSHKCGRCNRSKKEVSLHQHTVSVTSPLPPGHMATDTSALQHM